MASNGTENRLLFDVAGAVREFTNLHEPSKGEYFICKNCKVYGLKGWSYNEPYSDVMTGALVIGERK